MTAILALLLACGGGSTVAIDATPKPVEGAECEVCGMTVRDQPSPWAEVLHRDGERAFLCSVADLRAYLQNPSAHGKPVEVWVQALPADYDPSSAVGSDTYPWIPAADAVFVVGVARTGVMGVPALELRESQHCRAGSSEVRRPRGNVGCHRGFSLQRDTGGMT